MQVTKLVLVCLKINFLLVFISTVQASTFLRAFEEVVSSSTFRFVRNAKTLEIDAYRNFKPTKFSKINDNKRNFMTNRIIRGFCSINNKQPLIDVLDDYGIRTGEALSRKKIHELGKVHRAVHLYLFDESNNLLLQRRSYKTDHYPGMLSISLTGHVDAGESSIEALRREIQEELNFNPIIMKTDFLFSFRQDAIISPTYIDRQFNDVYACWHKFKVEDILFDSNDISEVKLVSFSEFKSMVDNEKSELAPVYKRECSDVVYFLRSRLL